MLFLNFALTLGVFMCSAVNGFLFFPASMARASTPLRSTMEKRPSSPSTPENIFCSPAGYTVSKFPLLNKGTSFSQKDRDAHGLRGLIPAGDPLPLEAKVELTMEQLRKKATPLDKYIFLHTLQDADETLFYATLVKHTAEVMPFVYTPTVGQACQEWSHITRHTPRGLYLSLKDKGQIRKILDNWPEEQVSTIVVTDGERILGLGDLGVNGMGIPIGKLALYTACAGINPAHCLPVHLDVGTNTQSILDDPYYMGLKQPRERGPAYDGLVAEFFAACQDKYGRNVLIQFEDFGNSNAFRLLDTYQHTACCFNDDIQGTASVVVAGVVASLPLAQKKQVSDHTFLFYGAGEAGVGIAQMLAMAIQKERGCSLEEARKQIWLVDSQGLVTSARPDKLAHHKEPFAHSLPGGGEEQTYPATLLECVERIKPTALIGVSAQGASFTKEVCAKMAVLNAKPLIFALSNPTSKAECTAQQAYEYTNGQCVFASGSPFDRVTLADGRSFLPGQGNNAYIFPGVGLGAIASQAVTLTDEDLYVAAISLSEQVPQERFDQGCIYPALSEIREVSAKIAAAVATNIFRTGRNAGGAAVKPPADMLAHCKALMYNPHY